MTGAIVDPTDANVAILPSGEIGVAVRVVPVGALSNPPTVAELNAVMGDAPILGYGGFDERR